MSALFLILVSLTMTRFSEKMLISTRCITYMVSCPTWSKNLGRSLLAAAAVCGINTESPENAINFFFLWRVKLHPIGAKRFCDSLITHSFVQLVELILKCLWENMPMPSKVHIFWEGHKILRNLHLTFVLCRISQK